jgi:hypothetical protein
MTALRPFEDHRFVGDKRTFLVHDLENETERCDIDSIVTRESIQLFGPDHLVEARNRGFRSCPHCDLVTSR